MIHHGARLTVRCEASHGRGRVCLHVQEFAPLHVGQHHDVVHHIVVKLQRGVCCGHTGRHGKRGHPKTCAWGAALGNNAACAGGGVVLHRIDGLLPLGEQADAVARRPHAGCFECEALSHGRIGALVVAVSAGEVNAFLQLQGKEYGSDKGEGKW